jgi:hypothetical protein
MTTLRTGPVAVLGEQALPAPDFSHLRRLTDDTGLFEHARHAVVRRAHGYCTDDVGRGLVVTSREPDPPASLLRLAECYLTFLTHAQDERRGFRNRLGFDRRWIDEPGVGDWWGRALWGLGTAAARSPAVWIRDEARAAFALGARCRSPDVRAMVFAGLGAAELLRVSPHDDSATTLLLDAARAVGVPQRDPSWLWPQPRLTYANAALAEVVILAGHLCGDTALLDRGLTMLTWLYSLQNDDGRLSVVPASGWHRGAPRPVGDQQPIEVAALADAAASAATATGDPQWTMLVHAAGRWFLGDNDIGRPMRDPDTGGGYDGLTPRGPNLNQGAESTLALIATMQLNRAVR